MEQIGKVLPQISPSSGSRASPTNLPSKPVGPPPPPAIVDRGCDVELPRRLLSTWTPADGARQIVRALVPKERAALECRQAELQDGLRPHRRAEEGSVKALIAGMLGGFRSMRAQGDDALATVETTRFVLAEFPVWAISKACVMIARNEVSRDNRWPPNDAELAEIVGRIVKPYKDNLKRADLLLTAKVEESVKVPTQSIPRQEATQAPPEAHRDGLHAKRVMADLEARKFRAQTPEPLSPEK